jgi:hypothetical protein
MSNQALINIMAVLFTITTVAVLLYPVFRILPSWLEGSVNRKIKFHSDAVAALATEMARTQHDSAHLARLTEQYEWNRSALAALAPNAVVAEPAPQRQANAAA